MRIKSITDTAILRNGVKMPWLGLGVYLVEDGQQLEHSVLAALQAGYRSIDTAAVYGNEAGVGAALTKSSLAREDIFITTKVWNNDHGYENTLEAFENSRKRLGLEYIDLYLIHWPVKGRYLETWRALETLYKAGSVRAIGTSNFHEHHLRDIMAHSEIKPMVNQVEFHPLLTQQKLRDFCAVNHIQFEAWSPLMQGRLDIPVLQELSKKYGKTPAQIVLRWDLQHDAVTIPKSVHSNRIIENAAIFDFELAAEDLQKIDELNKKYRLGPDPDNFNF